MTAIHQPSDLDAYDTTTIDFEAFAPLDGVSFGPGAGQPFAGLGVEMGPATIVAGANVPGGSGGVGIRSNVIYSPGSQSSLTLNFPTPQRAFACFYRDRLASGLTLVAADPKGWTLEQQTFPASGYAGIVRPTADLGLVYLLAPHATAIDASASRLFIDDVSIARDLRPLPGARLRPLTRSVLVLGGARGDARGVEIGPHGVRPIPPWNPELVRAEAGMDLLRLAERVSDAPTRARLTSIAHALLLEATRKEPPKTKSPRRRRRRA